MLSCGHVYLKVSPGVGIASSFVFRFVFRVVMFGILWKMRPGLDRLTLCQPQFCSSLRTRCGEIKRLKCQRQSERINAVASSHPGSFAIMTLSTNCQSAQTSEGFCFLSRGWHCVCHAKNPPSSWPPRRHYMAGSKQNVDAASLWTSRRQKAERLETRLNQPRLKFSVWIKKSAGDNWRTYSKTRTKKSFLIRQPQNREESE